MHYSVPTILEFLKLLLDEGQSISTLRVCLFLKTPRTFHPPRATRVPACSSPGARGPTLSPILALGTIGAEVGYRKNWNPSGHFFSKACSVYTAASGGPTSSFSVMVVLTALVPLD